MPEVTIDHGGFTCLFIEQREAALVGLEDMDHLLVSHPVKDFAESFRVYLRLADETINRSVHHEGITLIDVEGVTGVLVHYTTGGITEVGGVTTLGSIHEIFEIIVVHSMKDLSIVMVEDTETIGVNTASRIEDVERDCFCFWIVDNYTHNIFCFLVISFSWCLNRVLRLTIHIGDVAEDARHIFRSSAMTNRVTQEDDNIILKG